jgi:capsular polysaccharide biosynthesis protein
MSRNLVNGEDVEKVLGSRGFTHHTLENCRFMDQASMFSQADLVVGNMGAAMVNTIFCRPATPIVHLIPSGWDDPFYWDLASVLRHEHFAIYGASSGRYFHDPFTIDTDILQGVLDALGATVE